MASGADSTLVLHPEGLSDITFDLTGAAARSSGGYVVSLDTLRLNEAKRLEIAYSEGPNVEGGEAISFSNPLVTVTFSVLVYGTTQAIMIQKVEDLLAAVANQKGGTLEYKPDGLGAGIRSTFYHYEQSPPPEPRERWDKGPHDSGLYRMQVGVELQTQPFATSDPDSPVSVLNATTVYNQDDSAVGYATISAANLKGTEEALTQLRIRNMESGTWAAIQRLWYARRTQGTLGNFSPILEGGTADSDSSIHWSTESDTTRRSDNFLRYAPPQAANDLWAYRYYDISNITDHEGKAAVAVICRSLAESREDWDLKAALRVADVIVETAVKNVSTVGMWTVLILGELDIPPTPISDDESYATKLYLYLRRNSGDENSAIDIDFVDLLYVDEYPQQVTISDGFTDSYKLLLENLKRELCHVVDQSTLALDRVATPICPLLRLKPGGDNRIDFIWERLIASIEDGFDDYEAWRWLQAAGFESDEPWSTDNGGSVDTTYYAEGSQALRITPNIGGGGSSFWEYGEWDLDTEGRFSADDFVYIAVYKDAAFSPDVDGTFTLYFTDTGNGQYTKATDANTLANGWNAVKYKKSDFGASGSPSWSSINTLSIVLINCGTTGFLVFDDWRISKADPDYATLGNDTGDVWDFMRDVWHIEEQDSTDHALGCIDNAAALEQVALIHEAPPTDIKLLASVRAKRDDGEVGLVFRCADGTSGSEDMAAFFIDTNSDKLELMKWAAGSASDIATALDQTTAPDTNYWLGVRMIGNRVRCYFGTSKAAIWDDEHNEFVASARKFNETDSVFASGGALASGQCGVLSIGTLGRFDDVELYGLAGHIPGDTIEVEAKALYRTIYPFRE